MKTYYIAEGANQNGPFTYEELKSIVINRSTLVWNASLEGWKQAGSINELADLFTQGPPPIPSIEGIDVNDSKDHSSIEYSQVEDIAGVDYQKGMMVTGVFLFLNLITTNFPLGVLGMAITSFLAIISWYYFRAYFLAKGDAITSTCIKAIMVSQGLYGVAYIIAKMTNWFEVIGNSIVELILNFIFGGGDSTYSDQLSFMVSLIIIMFSIAIVGVFLAPFRILFVNKQYGLPLKRIALSTMFFLPALFFQYADQGLFLGEEAGLVSRAIYCLPFILLLHHFYRANNEDETIEL